MNSLNHCRARVVHQVAERLHAADDWDSLMRSAVEETGHAVQASRVYIQWLPPGPDEQARLKGSGTIGRWVGRAMARHLTNVRRLSRRVLTS